MNKVTVLGVDFDNKSMSEFQNTFIERLNNRQSTFIVTANPEIVMVAQDDPDFMATIKRADYVTADGIGIVKAGKMLHTPLKERVAGFDLFMWFLNVAEKRGSRVYLIGAQPEVITCVREKLTLDYPSIELVGARDGYFKEDLNEIANEIAATEPEMVFVALGFPRQEQLIDLMRINGVPAMMMGVGGSFDVLAGAAKRAPKLMQDLHLEWFYRLIKNPSRFKRMLVLPKFVLEVKKRGDGE
ncbi:MULTISPECIES: WecB/TagA/CpsF family glycosyltransferase [Amylolactobacillus]|nr:MULTISPECIES: WecB/TagA/CpsF family glycosyltransferase [Amylolactobacillus]APT18847.1 glycosyltransferase [Amylolactobacillus amylophilus DSM 20533 = JCM 1125]GED80929.1 acetylglucosaminyldiphosphoundecaprenol acetyl-beta-D-mannosaminyltransferase [Amylolactobacillus amylophilus]